MEDTKRGGSHYFKSNIKKLHSGRNISSFSRYVSSWLELEQKGGNPASLITQLQFFNMEMAASWCGAVLIQDELVHLTKQMASWRRNTLFKRINNIFTVYSLWPTDTESRWWILFLFSFFNRWIFLIYSWFAKEAVLHLVKTPQATKYTWFTDINLCPL